MKAFCWVYDQNLQMKQLIYFLLILTLVQCKPARVPMSDFERGVQFYQDSVYDSAKVYLVKAVEIDSNKGAAFFYLANITFHQGYFYCYVNHDNVDSAIALYRQAEKYGFRSEELYDNLTGCYHWVNNPEAKEQGLTESLKNADNHVGSLYLRADTRKRLKDFSGALMDYEKVISLRKDNEFGFSPVYKAGLMHYKLGDSVKAQEYFLLSIKQSGKESLRAYEDWK